jgi:hypothetical protein
VTRGADPGAKEVCFTGKDAALSDNSGNSCGRVVFCQCLLDFGLGVLHRVRRRHGFNRSVTLAATRQAPPQSVPSP